MPKAIALYMGKDKAPGACEIYRVNMPLTHVHENRRKGGWTAEWTTFVGPAMEALKYGSAYWRHFIDTFDLFILPRFFIPDDSHYGNQMLNVIQGLKNYGKPVVYEVDDDYTNEFRHVVNGDAITPASLCDAITVTTPQLAERMTQLTGRPTYVLPNMTDPLVWDRPVPPRHPSLEGKLIIGLSGSATHYGDWQVFEDVFRPLLDKYPQVHLFITGFHPNYLRDLPNTSYIPGQDYQTYAQIVKTCDIILAAVDPHDGFNLSKSEIKATEGQSARRILPDGRSAGAAVVATDNPIYRLGIQPEKTGLLVEHTPMAWYDALERLIVESSLRVSLQVQGYKWARQHRNIETGWHRWVDAYSKILRSTSPSSGEKPHVPSRAKRNLQHRPTVG